jgi:hypothetical protein
MDGGRTGEYGRIYDHAVQKCRGDAHVRGHSTTADFALELSRDQQFLGSVAPMTRGVMWFFARGAHERRSCETRLAFDGTGAKDRSRVERFDESRPPAHIEQPRSFCLHPAPFAVSFRSPWKEWVCR